MAEKTLSFKIDITGVSNEAAELAKIELQLKNIKKERAELMKQATSPNHIASSEETRRLAAYNKEIKEQETALKTLKRVVDTANDSLARKKALLIELVQKSDAASKSIRDAMAPAIKKLNDEIKAGEEARGQFSRSVGNYAGKIKEFFVEMATGGVVIAAAEKLLEGLKDAIASTTFGIDLMNNTMAVSKQLFYDIAINGKIDFQRMINASKIQQELNNLRVEEGFEMLKLSKINREEQAVREQSIDRTKTHAERLELLNKVVELESQKTEIKVGHLNKELEAKQKLFAQNNADEKLAMEILAIKTKINDAYAEEDAAMRSVQTQRAGFIQEEIDQRKKMYDAWMDEIEKTNKEEAEQAKKTQQEKFDNAIRLQIAGITVANEIDKKGQDETDELTKQIQQEQEQQNKWEIQAITEKVDGEIKVEKEGIDKSIDAQKKASEARLKSREAEEEAKMKIASSATDILNAIAGKNKALLMASLIADKALAIAEVIIQTQKANAAVRAWGALAGPPGMILAEAAVIKNRIASAYSIASIGVAAGVGLTGINSSGKYAKGGRIVSGVPINTGTVDDTLIAVNKSETVLTQRHIAALGGSGVMRRIGVPGYAEGGYIGQQAPVIPSSGPDFNSMVEAIRNIQIHLDINKVNSSQKEIQVITQPQRI